MNRRRFLKHAAATAVVVGSSALSLNYFLRQSPPAVISTASSTTVTGELTTTSASVNSSSTSLSSSTEAIQLASLQGRLFFDYNGNGKQDTKEPTVAGALIQLKDDTGKVIVETLTDSSGDYKLEDVKTGSYTLHIGVDHFSDKRFRYMCTSPDEFRPVAEGCDQSLAADGTMDIGLMEGFLTLPFPKDTKYEIVYYVDIGKNGSPKDWRGRGRTYQRGTYKHAGTDFAIDMGTPILASAPGITRWIGDDPNGGRYVWLQHVDGYYTTYSHLSKLEVAEGEIIARGERLGLSGINSSNGFPHVHFEVDKPPPRVTGDFSLYCVDPYRSLVPPLGSSCSLWTKDNDPQYAKT